MPQPVPVSKVSGLVYARAGVYNLRAILTEIHARRQKANLDHTAETRVGYSASYAVPVHERLYVIHKNGQAKFLEQPIRTEKSAMAAIIRAKLRGRTTLKAAQLEAAKHLFAVSQKLVPVFTGALKASGFIK